MLESAIKTFADNLSALRDFVRLVGSLLDDRQRELPEQHRRELIPLALLISRTDVGPKLSEAKVRELETAFGGKIEIKEKTDAEGHKTWSAAIHEQNWDAESVFGFVRIATGHRTLLYRSALISLVSAAEWFLSQVIRTHFEKFPDASGTGGKTLTLEDLKSLGSVEDAQRYLIDLRIDEIMWGSFEDWVRFLTSTVRLSAAYLVPDRDALIEVFQRRNVMVHNNGRVHSSYMHKVPPELRKGVSLGGELSVSPDYLSRAIDLVEKNFILLGAELWKQLEPAQEKRAEALIGIAFDRLKSELWVVSEGLSFFTLNDKKMSECSLLVAQLNYWQSVRWQGRFPEVQKEVQASDFSAKDDLFQLARYALLDDYDTFFKLIPLRTWPIFREARKDPRFRKYAGRTFQGAGRKKDATSPKRPSGKLKAVAGGGGRRLAR